MSLINSAVSAQCLFGTTLTLNGTGTYGSFSGWVHAPATLAESNINQWLVLCDLYAAVLNIQNNCCVSGCNGVTFDVTYQPIDATGNGVVDSLILDFTNSVIPAGFNDCGGNTTITITDSTGTSITTSVNVTTAALGSNPNISLSGLTTTAPITVTIPFCVTDGSSQCSDRQTLIIPLQLPCPTINVTSVLTDINVSFTNSLGTGVVYSIVAIDTTTSATLGQTVITNPGPLVTHTFGGAIGGRDYDIVLTITQNGFSKTCPPVTITAQGNPTGYVITFCKDGVTANVTWVGTPPTLGNVYNWVNNLYTIEACITVTAGPTFLTPIDYILNSSELSAVFDDCTVCDSNCIDYTVETTTTASGTYVDCDGNTQSFSLGGGFGLDTRFCAKENTINVTGDFTISLNGPCAI